MTLKEANDWFKKYHGIPKGFKIDHHENCGYWWSTQCSRKKCKLVLEKCDHTKNRKN